MQSLLPASRRLGWSSLPGLLLMMLLQRTPVITVAVVSEEMVLASPIGALLKSAVATALALGTVNTMVGATPLVPSSGTAGGVTVTAGSAVSIFYTVNGTQTPPQSWSIGGSIPPGLTFSGRSTPGNVNVSTLQLSGTPTTAGSFDVTLQAWEFTNASGDSTPVYSYTITVNGGITNVAPSFTSQPSSQTVTAGNSVTFSAAADGTPTPTYQWRKNGANIGGATSSSYTIGSVSLGDAGDYSVVASNSAGSATSNTATLTVNSAPVAPSFTVHPASQTIPQGTGVTFTAAAVGNPSPTYQWTKNGADIPGATSTSYSISVVAPGDAGSYAVRASNSQGSTTSNAATLTVGPPLTPPSFTLHPQSQSAVAGNSVTFTATATGSPSPTYQWRKGGANIGGATSSSYTIATLTLGDAGSYDVVATNSQGSATSNAATLTVSPPKGFARISAGRYHSLRLDTDARLLATGTNVYGQLGTGNTTTYTSPQQVTLAGQTVVDVSAGAQHSLVLTAAGQLWGTGINDLGQLGDGTTTARSSYAQITTGVAGIAAGRLHSAFLKADGTLWTMGGNDEGQLGNGTTTDSLTPVQIASGVIDLAVGIRQTLFIKADGTLWGTGDLYGAGLTTSTPIQLATGVVHVAAGAYHSVFVKADGTAWALGWNAFGQLGNGTTTDATSPVQIATGVRVVAAGYFHTALLKSDGSLWVTGRNDAGQLGDGTSANRASPFQLATGVAAVTASEAYTLFTKTDGGLWAAGLNGNGQFGNGNSVSASTPVLVTPGTLTSPAAPSGLAAVVPVSSDRIRLTWTPQSSAGDYRLLRNTTNDSNTATTIASDLRWAFYEDTTAASGVTYFYWIVAGNGAGTSSASSPVSSSVVVVGAPTIGTQPQAGAAIEGANVTFTVGASGNPSPSYQWQRLPVGSGTWASLANGGAYSGATTASLTVSSVSLAMNGDQFRCVVSNSAGSVNSSAVALSVYGNPVVKDYNGDGLSDVLWQDAATGERAMWLMKGTSIPSWLSMGVLPAAWRMAAVGDFTGDGKPDILWENSITGEHYLWVMNGPAYTSGLALATTSTSWHVVGAADFNADGKPDIVWENTATGDRSVWYMNGTTQTGSDSLGTVSTDWHIAGVGDFNADTKPDLLWENTVTGDRSIGLMNGITQTSSVGLGTIPTSWHMIAAADFNADNKTDILWLNSATGELGCWLMNGTVYLDWLGLGLLPQDWNLNPVCAADFNADGVVDILWENTATGDRGLWLMHGSPFPLWVRLGNVPAVWNLMGSADLNNDGQRDLVWENTSTGERVLWTMNGTNQIGTQSLLTLDPSWRIAALADFNADHKPDLLWQNLTTGDRVIWYMDGTTNTGSTGLGGIPVQWKMVAAVDFDGDGKTDILWQNTSTGDIGIWLMDGANYLGWAGLGTIDPIWRMAGAADYNGDGQADILWENTSTGERGYWIMNGTVSVGYFQLGVVPTSWSARN